MKKWINQIIILLVSINTFSQTKENIIDLIAPPQPFYQFASSVELSYFTPLSDSKNEFDPAPYFNIVLKYNPGFFDYFLIHGEIGYLTSNIKNTKSKYSILPIGIGINYSYPLFQDIFITSRLSTGIYHINIDGEKYNNYYWKINGGFQYNIAENYEIRLFSEYVDFYDMYGGPRGLNTGFSFNYAFGSPLTEKDIQFLSFDTDGVFAAIYPTYYKKNIGVLKIKNTSGDTIRNIKLSLHIKNYMDDKTYSLYPPRMLAKNETALLPVYAFFNAHIKTLDTDVNTTGVLEVEYYKSDKKKYLKRDLIKIRIYGKNAMTWYDLRRLGSFITLKDQNIVNFARKSIISNSNGLSEDLTHIIQIMERLKQYKMKYIRDPEARYHTFGEQKLVVDYVQFPVETLSRKTGDCDDLTVLLSSLLESIGIPTAFVSTPGHIFLMAEVKDMSFTEGVIQYQGRKWVPIETTLIEEGFSTAWKKGFQIYTTQPIEKILTFFEAAKEYEPISIDKKVNLSFDLKEEGLNLELESVKAFLENSKGDEPENLDPHQLNLKAVLFCELGNLEKGEQYFLKAIEKRKEYKSPYYNLIILYQKKKEFEKAHRIYKQFVGIYLKDEKADKLMKKLHYDLKKSKVDIKAIQKKTGASKKGSFFLKLEPWVKD